MTEKNLDELPKGWARAKLGEIAEQINPGFPSGKHNTEGKGVPHLRPMNISAKGEIELSNLKYVEVAKYDVLLKGDVLFNNTNSPKLLGKTSYIKINTNWAYSNHMTRIKLNQENINSALIAHMLHYLFFTGYFKINCVHHVNQASIGIGFLADKVILPIPPFNEQHRIVAKIEELFSDLDAGVEGLKKAKAQLKLYRQAVLKAAFEGRLTAAWRDENQDKLFPPLNLLLQRGKFEESPVDVSSLKELPKGWLWARLYQVIDNTLIGVVRSANQLNREGRGVGYLKMNNIDMDGNVSFGDIVFVEVSKDEMARYEIRKNDIFFNTRNSFELVGKTGIVKVHPKNMIFNNNIMRIRTIDDVSSVFLAYQMCSIDFRKRMEKIKRATTNVAAIYAKDLMPLPISLPPKDEQLHLVEEIEKRCSILDETEKAIDKSLRQSEKVRQSILKKAFSGELVPQDPEDEPAAELLKRIKGEKAGHAAGKKPGRKAAQKDLNYG